MTAAALLQTFLAFLAGVATWDGIRALWRRTRRPLPKVAPAADVLTDRTMGAVYTDSNGRRWTLHQRTVNMATDNRGTTMVLELHQQPGEPR